MRFRPADYNPAWLLVGDRTSLYALDMTGAGDDRPCVEQLGPGVYILENNPLHADSPKADHVRELLGGLGVGGDAGLSVGVDAGLGLGAGAGAGLSVGVGVGADAGADALHGTGLIERIRAVLVDHSVPEVAPEVAAEPGPAPVEGGRQRPVETLAACVHTDEYGTRSSTIVSVASSPARHPQVLVADGHPCTSPYVDATDLFVP